MIPWVEIERANRVDSVTSVLACATRVFAQPGVRFMHKIRPVDANASVRVEKLPEGLIWNKVRNLVDGVVKAPGEYVYEVEVSVGGKTTTVPVRLLVSDELQQPVPFMGWLSWNVYGGEIDEDKIKATADALERYGLRDAGYRYLCIDDLWHAPSREEGTDRPLYDRVKFPGGMKALADYVHGKGLKFGIYSDAADKTCGGSFGSYGHEATDARQYAEWGVDLLKYDYCNAPFEADSALVRYKAMGDALKASGRDILFYMCEWGEREPWKWGTETGATTWRCTYDTRDCWCGVDGGIGVLQSIERMKDLWAYSGPNRYNDADMMCVGLHGRGKSSNDLCKGRPGMTDVEYRSQFSLWCMWASPLTLSFDVTRISERDLDIILNRELIAVNQDRLGQQAELVEEGDGVQTYMKDLENGDVAIAVINLNESPVQATLSFDKLSALSATATYTFRDLWAGKNIGDFSRAFTVEIAPHETKVYRLSRR